MKDKTDYQNLFYKICCQCCFQDLGSTVVRLRGRRCRRDSNQTTTLYNYTGKETIFSRHVGKGLRRTFYRKIGFNLQQTTYQPKKFTRRV